MIADFDTHTLLLVVGFVLVSLVSFAAGVLRGYTRARKGSDQS